VIAQGKSPVIALIKIEFISVSPPLECTLSSFRRRVRDEDHKALKTPKDLQINHLSSSSPAMDQARSKRLYPNSSANEISEYTRKYPCNLDS
jgi:hypothetical protein